MMHLLLTLALPAQLGAALPPDSVDRLRSRARAAEASFERRARALAPISWGGFDGRNCDEIIGRFCLRYDSTAARPPASEVGSVIDARRDAVETVRRYFSAAPGARDAAGPLVRLLVLDNRAAEAVSAAATFAALSPDTLWAELLLGISHQAAGQPAVAERHFVRALARMDDATRRVWADPRWLLDYREQRLLDRLSAGARAEYERRFWIVSDPLWLTPGNERWTEHMARHAEARLLADVPVVTGMVRWGRDLDQLTVRYGTPSSRSQVRGNMPWDPSSFIEYFDTAQRAYTPERWLNDGLPEPPLPGERPPLYASRVKSGYALRTVTRLLDLPHQVTRFLTGDEVIVRVDGALAATPAPATGTPAAGDPAAAPPAGAVPGAASRGTIELGLFAYDSAFTRRVQTVRTARWSGDTTRFTLTVRAPPGQLVYSVEALDTAGDYAARARYALPAFLPGDGPVVSDLLVARQFPAERLPGRRDDPLLHALTELRVQRGDTVGIYAEVYRLTRSGPDAVRVELALEPAQGPGLLRQFARWLGRVAGVTQPSTDPRVAWSAEAEEGVHPLALNVPLVPDRAGLHALVLRVTDRGTGQTAESRRMLLIEDVPAGAPR
jgi:hypothetical protein